MYLTKLSVINFKNYEDYQLQFCKKFNCFVGSNGVGKTNLLDAIHYLSICKSYFNAIDSQNIKWNSGFFVIQGAFQNQNELHEIYCSLKRNAKKQFKLNKVEYTKLSDHIGKFPVVIITPSDSEIIDSGSDIRRKLIDSIISQCNKNYLTQLINYNQGLNQRNALLKLMAENSKIKLSDLDIWNEQLVHFGSQIIETRLKFIENFKPLFVKTHQYISNNELQQVDLNYQNTTTHDTFLEALKQSTQKDLALQYTSIGPHKDDLEFSLNQQSIKKYASQGQQKTFTLSLKLAQYEYVKMKTNCNPILLLDDLFDKLDETRIDQLITYLNNEAFGQIFITDTHAQRLENLLLSIEAEHKLFNITNESIYAHG